MRYFIRSMRPEQWIKNLAVFAGLIFSGKMLDPSMLLRSVIACALFSLMSGAVYVFNDICDREFDVKHEKKRKRPIASGALGVRGAVIGSGLIALSALCGSFFLHPPFGWIVFIYLIINVFYSLYLKKLVIIDVLTISLDFVLRVLGGVVVLSVTPTPWIIMATIFLSLFLAVSKRRQEVVLLKEDAALHRQALAQYSLAFLDQLVSFTSVAVVLSYMLFTGISGKNINLMYTIPFVLYGVMRYLYLIYARGRAFSPTEALAEDRPLQLCVILWFVAVAMILY